MRAIEGSFSETLWNTASTCRCLCGFDGAVNWKTRPDDQHGLWTLAPEWRTSRSGKRDANAVRHDGPVDLVPWVLVLGTLLVQAGDLRAHTVSTFADQSASFA